MYAITLSLVGQPISISSIAVAMGGTDMELIEVLLEPAYKHPNEREWQLRELLCDRMCTCGYVIKGMRTIISHVPACEYRKAMLELGYAL
jgi:hypothetical protein